MLEYSGSVKKGLVKRKLSNITKTVSLLFDCSFKMFIMNLLLQLMKASYHLN